jgi:hypothetical protein
MFWDAFFNIAFFLLEFILLALILDRDCTGKRIVITHPTSDAFTRPLWRQKLRRQKVEGSYLPTEPEW